MVQPSTESVGDSTRVSWLVFDNVQGLECYNSIKIERGLMDESSPSMAGFVLCLAPLMVALEEGGYFTDYMNQKIFHWFRYEDAKCSRVEWKAQNIKD